MDRRLSVTISALVVSYKKSLGGEEGGGYNRM